MRSCRLTLLGIILLGAATNIAVTLRRTMIPLEINGVVSTLEIRHEKHPGIDDIYLVTIDGRRYHVDSDLGTQLLPATEVEKSRWSRTMKTSEGPIRLSLSRDAASMLVAMPLLVSVGLLLMRRGFRRL